MEFGNSCNIFLFKWRQLTVHMWKSMSATLICLQTSINFNYILLFLASCCLCCTLKLLPGYDKTSSVSLWFDDFFLLWQMFCLLFCKPSFRDQPAFSKSGFCNLLRFNEIFFLIYYNLLIFFLLFVMILVEVGDEDWLSAKNGAQYTLGHRTQNRFRSEPRRRFSSERVKSAVAKH